MKMKLTDVFRSEHFCTLLQSAILNGMILEPFAVYSKTFFTKKQIQEPHKHYLVHYHRPRYKYLTAKFQPNTDYSGDAVRDVISPILNELLISM